MEHHFLLRQERGVSGGGSGVVPRRGSLPLKKRKVLSFPEDNDLPAPSKLAVACSMTSSGMPLSSLFASSSSLPSLPDLSSPWQHARAAAAAAAPRLPMSLPPVSPLVRPEAPWMSPGETASYGGDEHMAALALLSAASRSLSAATAGGRLALPPPMPLLPKTTGGDPARCRPAHHAADSAASAPTTSLRARMMHERHHVFRREGDALLKALHGERLAEEGDDDDADASISSSTSSVSDDDANNHTTPALASSSGAPTGPIGAPRASASASAPHPGGCHGRCARSGAYCQRSGSFRGSSYCKLHYHRYVGDEDDADGTAGRADAAARRGAGATAPLSAGKAGPGDGRGGADGGGKGPGHLHQDKRCTGAPWEVRCQATTTRGRPCAYVAADGKAYCNLHAYSFKTQGHRRGSAASASAEKVGASGTSTGGTTHAPLQLKSPVQGGRAVTVSSTTPSLTLGDTTLGEASLPSGKVKSISKRRAKHNDSPHPLLSKVPVDQWLGKIVKIACGPMAGKVGTVDRWGNGWITVRVAGVGSHNRRSFELFVVDGAAAAGEEQEINMSSSLHRSTVSPSPSSDCGSTTVKGPAVSIVHKVSYSYDGDDAPPGATSREDDKAVLVPETPTNERPMIDSLLSSAFRGRGDGDDGAHTIITPVSPKRARTELPLSESLALAQEGNAKKYRIDMLFGTAALERSRRSVHDRPSSGSTSDNSTGK